MPDGVEFERGSWSFAQLVAEEQDVVGRHASRKTRMQRYPVNGKAARGSATMRSLLVERPDAMPVDDPSER